MWLGFIVSSEKSEIPFVQYSQHLSGKILGSMLNLVFENECCHSASSALSISLFLFCIIYLWCCWPGSRCIEDVSPSSSIIELCCELLGKVSVGEVWLVVFLHEADDIFVLGPLPVPPEPFRAKTGHWEHSPVDEDAQLCLIIPLKKKKKKKIILL